MTTTHHVRAIRSVPELAQRRGHDLGYWCPICDYVTTRPVTDTGHPFCPHCDHEVMRQVWVRDPDRLREELEFEDRLRDRSNEIQRGAKGNPDY